MVVNLLWKSIFHYEWMNEWMNEWTMSRAKEETEQECIRKKKGAKESLTQSHKQYMNIYIKIGKEANDTPNMTQYVRKRRRRIFVIINIISGIIISQ